MLLQTQDEYFCSFSYLILTAIPWGRYRYHPHFIHGDTRSWGDWIICLRPHSSYAANLGFEPRPPRLWPSSPAFCCFIDIIFRELLLYCKMQKEGYEKWLWKCWQQLTYSIKNATSFWGMCQRGRNGQWIQFQVHCKIVPSETGTCKPGSREMHLTGGF